jgi:hypothetical protein
MTATAETAAMDNTTAVPAPGGWLTTLIQRARTRGVDNRDIATALEGSIVFRPLTIGRDRRNRLVGTMTGDDVTLADLFDLPAEDR